MTITTSNSPSSSPRRASLSSPTHQSPRRKSTPPTHRLRIVLEKATDLPKSDAEWAGGSSDPYVVFEFGPQNTLRTSVVDKSVNPTWPHEEFEFVLTDNDVEMHKVLNVYVKDYNVSSPDTLMATMSLDVVHWTGATKASNVHITPYPLILATSLASQAVKPMLHMAVTYLTEAEATSNVTGEIWEHERWVPTQGWSKHNLSHLFLDPPAWVNEEGTGGDNFVDAEVAPTGYKPVDGWEYKVAKGDSAGWMYAGSFLGPWHNKKVFTSVARRRLWERHYTRVNQEATAASS
ncbi:Aste57867_20450 [Aphanomyces stellatus]|uniref:Aste57867_20450 protein n=1 Tax=Aphanomyces stellatus TaxID=120398 RepID=A0A485LFQ3_9STRA|nr:hypothetical protein As57867_020384 [Aphanomyces stellatus]VFT97136.1 Aste57867_20450 [Aphanomyces stellatus]